MEDLHEKNGSGFAPQKIETKKILTILKIMDDGTSEKKVKKVKTVKKKKEKKETDKESTLKESKPKTTKILSEAKISRTKSSTAVASSIRSSTDSIPSRPSSASGNPRPTTPKTSETNLRKKISRAKSSTAVASSIPSSTGSIPSRPSSASGNSRPTAKASEINLRKKISSKDHSAPSSIRSSEEKKEHLEKNEPQEKKEKKENPRTPVPEETEVPLNSTLQIRLQFKKILQDCGNNAGLLLQLKSDFDDHLRDNGFLQPLAASALPKTPKKETKNPDGDVNETEVLPEGIVAPKHKNLTMSKEAWSSQGSSHTSSPRPPNVPAVVIPADTQRKPYSLSPTHGEVPKKPSYPATSSSSSSSASTSTSSSPPPSPKEVKKTPVIEVNDKPVSVASTNQLREPLKVSEIGPVSSDESAANSLKTTPTPTATTSFDVSKLSQGERDILKEKAFERISKIKEKLRATQM
jgi:hypothetical protein